MIDVSKIQRWYPPKESYSFSAWETFSGEFFNFRTGVNVSVLNLNESDFEIKLAGEVKVENDDDCWAIVLKFNELNNVVKKIMAASFRAGEEKAKKDLRGFLGI